MNEEEKIQFRKMNEDIKAIKEDVSKVGGQVREMYTALMGSEIGKDGGLVKRIVGLEEENIELRKEIQEMKMEAAKAGLYIKIIWGMAGALASTLTALALKTMFG